MHAVVRTYSGKGAKELFDLLKQREADVGRVMGSVPGFQSYLAIRTGTGGVSITVCEDRAGTDESVRAARDWIQENAPDLAVGAPEVAEGTVVIDFD